VNGQAAVHAILLSAAVMGAIYAWRWLTGRGKLPATAKLSPAALIGYGPQVSPEGYLVAWGIVYGGLSMLSTVLPGMAGSLALLILLTGAIANFSSASTTALALVKLKTGTTPAGPEGEAPDPSMTAGLEGKFSGGFTALTRPGEVAPTKLPPAPGAIKVKHKLPIEWKRLEYLIKHGGPHGHLTQAGVQSIIGGRETLAHAESRLGL
jgi:hypothetical protein